MTNRITLNSVIVVVTLWLTFVVHAQVALIYSRAWFAWYVPELRDGFATWLAEGLMICFLRPWSILFNDVTGTWMFEKPTGLLLVAYGPISLLWFSKVRWLRLVPAVLLAVIIVTILSRMGDARPLFLFSRGMTILLFVTAVGLLMARFQSKMTEKYPTKKIQKASRPAHSKRRINLGFTLIEVLIVIAIILILVAISLAVYGKSKQNAMVSREIQQIRQIYIAINLYELDYDSMSPRMLTDLEGAYLDSKYLTCPTDERKALNRDSWPSNPWIYGVGVDEQELIDARSPFINSYFYLKTWEGRFHQSRTYDASRSDPTVGLVAGAGLLRCSGTCLDSNRCVGGCEYPTRPGQPWTEGHPALNMSGKIVVVRTDGSTYVRVRPENCPPTDFGYSQLFLEASLDCTTPIPLGGS